MTAPTMDERRAVARRMRGYECPVLPSHQTTREAVDAAVECMGLEDDEEMCTVRHFLDRLAELIDPVADTTMSAYDMLPEDDRAALDWVREHGGLDHVKSEWRSRVPYDRYERRRQSLLGHIAECERALGRRNERIADMGLRIKSIEVENAKLRKRAMPEGYEWPRYTSGELVEVGDDVVGPDYGERIHVNAIKFHANGFTLYDKSGFDKWYESDDRFERPIADTWERLEEDANDLIYDIGFHLGDYSTSDFNETGDSVQDRIRDLVRRARALAERGL